MGFSAKQVKALRRNLDHRYVRTREAHGRELSYIEGWYAISEANRIFGFDGWSRETVESRCVLARENRGAFLAVYTARVRISVQAGGTMIIREGHGSGEGRGASPGGTTMPSRLRKPMPPSGPWLPLADRSDSRCMGLVSPHQCSKGYPSRLLRQNPSSVLDFILMIQRQFQGRRVTTVAANMRR
jgi:Rad52/22 family double-strand break repair protein